MNKYLFIIMLLVFATTLFFSKVLEVGSVNSSYNTIKAAVFDASDGDTIRIYAGNYVENLRFSKTLTIEGVNTHNVILKPLNPNLPTIMVENCKMLNISGLTIYGDTISISLAMTNATISGNKIYSSGDGIRAGTLNHEIKIISNQIAGNFNNIKNLNTNGIMLVGVGKTTIENNDIQSFATGIYLGGKKPVKISENQLHLNYYGIYVSGNTAAIISDNRLFKNNRSGILLVSKPVVTITANYFTSNNTYDIMVSDKACSNEFLINFTGKISGNSNIFDEPPKICPPDYVLSEDFIKGS